MTLYRRRLPHVYETHPLVFLRGVYTAVYRRIGISPAARYSPYWTAS